VLLIETKLGMSDIHGIGLFCVAPIPKDTKVWEFNPLLDVTFDEDAIAALPPAVHTFMQMYSYRSVETKQFIVNIDLARHMNHSDTPSLNSDAQSNYFAAYDLPAGAELTCDYREFALEGCSDFLSKASSV
jgi:uncharacterized protein